MTIVPGDPRPTLAAPDDDPYLWLEAVDGPDAVAWVEGQNAATLARFGDARFAADRDTLTAIFDRPDNIPLVGRRGRRLFNFWKDAQHSRGLWGVSYFRWLFVENFVLPEALRGQGLGTRLMREAEAVALARGCLGVWLDTFTFQARGFYEKLGYRVFGAIDDYPPGHRRFFLAKRLDG